MPSLDPSSQLPATVESPDLPVALAERLRERGRGAFAPNTVRALAADSRVFLAW